MRRRRFVLAAALALVACGGEETTAPRPPAPVAGEYLLVSINDQPVPFTVSQSAGELVEVQGATLSLRADASFETLLVVRVYRGETLRTIVQETRGTYTATPGAVQLTYRDGSGASLLRANGRLRQTDGSFVLVYAPFAR